MSKEFEWEWTNQKEFKRSIDALGRYTSDFRIPFRLIASDFYRSQRIIFNLKSEGLYKPLGGKNYNAPSGFGNQTKRQRAEDVKERRTGHAWAPILYGVTGDLRDSTLSPNHPNSVFFLGRKQLVIGTNIEYGKYHQKGTKNMHQRKFIFIDGGPNDASRSSGITGRSQRWKLIIQEHIKQIVTGRI